MLAGRALTGSPQTRAHTQTHTTTPAPDLKSSTRMVSMAGSLGFGISSLGMGLLWGLEALFLRFHISQFTACPELIHARASRSSWEEPQCHFRVNTGVARKPLLQWKRAGVLHRSTVATAPYCSVVPLGFTKAHCCLFQAREMQAGCEPIPRAPSFCTERYSVALIFCGSSSSSVLHSCHRAPYTPIKRGSGTPHPPWELA